MAAFAGMLEPAAARAAAARRLDLTFQVSFKRSGETVRQAARRQLLRGR